MMSPEKALRELSEPWPPGEKVKAAIGRAAKLAGLSYWRCSDIWYRKARSVEEYEITAIADALERKRELEAKNELAELRRRLAALETRMLSTDEDFYRPEIGFFRNVACASS